METKSPFLIIISSFIIFLFWLTKKIKARTVSHKFPPGPWKLPLIGNLHQLALGGSLPHHTLAKLSHKYGPLMHLQLGEISAVIVSSPDLAKEIMKTHDLSFVNRPQLLCPKILAYDSTDIAFAPYGDYWRQMRKICTSELLSAKRVQSFCSIREDEVEKLIQSIHHFSNSSEPLDLTKTVTSLVSSFVTRAAFGGKSEYEDELLCLLKEAVEMAGGFDVADLFPSFTPIHVITGMKGKLENMQKKLDRILTSIIKDHQSKSNHGLQSENLVDVLLCVQQSGSLDIPISDDNVKAVLWDVFAAGSDTSATAIEWTMSELMKNPSVRNKLQSEIREAFKENNKIHESDIHKLSYLKSVIKETMRLHPPVPLLLPRECIEPCKIGGYEIPIKTKVIVNAWLLGRDPKYWYDAQKFIPERFDDAGFDFSKVNNRFEYIPFGAGRRVCPGILFGVANIELPLVALLYHFDWDLPYGMKVEELDMDEAFGAAVARRNSLCLIPTPYV
ncbi:cytochrome P450 71D8-like [Vicia villosa]|uniref:cytochrome P450 71D8-like n=1 Tax=Vicia villosa TaxID=3911 RepID=UPI00273B5383|nr:cytochrome P450 71D8-like [Vicia villosa]